MLENGHVRKFYRNENFLAHQKGSQREIGKIKSYLPSITIEFDGTPTC